MGSNASKQFSASQGARLACIALMLLGATVNAASEFVIEEIIVTAQRFEENAGSVPIAINAFNDTMIEDRQIVALADLQIFSPNLSYTTNNVGDMNISVRGVGSLVSVNDGESGVSLHVNEVPLAPGQPPIELYDVQRLEVLRGPQGTLYGRNATGGAVNIITNKPNFDGVSGYLDAEAGEYDLLRFRGALNAPLGDSLAFRIAGLSIDRDGFTDNLAGGQVPGIGDEIDGRDLYSVRASATWRISERTEVWASYERFDEDDDRMFTHNQLCKTSRTPAQITGCEPGEFALEPASIAAHGFGLNYGFRGMTVLGARDAESGLVYAYPRPTITNLRDVHLDFEPVYEMEQDLWQLGFRHTFDWGELNINGGYQEWVRHDASDFDWSVGPEFSPIALVPDGVYPVSAVPDGVKGLSGDVCNVEAGLAGTLGGCALDARLTREFRYLDTDEEREQYSAEVRMRTILEGPINFLVGANYVRSKSHFLRTQFENSLDLISSIGGIVTESFRFPELFDIALVVGPPMDAEEAKLEFESISAFGEIYFDVSEALKLTVGLRYNRDEKKIADRSIFFPALDLNAPNIFNGALGPNPVWARSNIFDPTLGPGIYEFYDLPYTFPPLGNFAQIPIVEQFNEQRVITGTPTKQTWDAWSGRIGFDWQASANAMIYGFYSRGYKPGGFNPGTNLGFIATTSLTPSPTYKREDVNAFEIGMKSLWWDGTLSLNAAAFFNDYNNLQLSEMAVEVIASSTSNANIDAEMYGMELEARWRPAFAPRAELELGYSWLHAELKDEAPRIDPLDLTGGNPDYVVLTTDAVNTRLVARIDEVLPLVDAAIAGRWAVGPDQAPAAQYPNGIPAWWLAFGSFLPANGVEVLDGIPVPIAGNRVPETPEHTVHLATSYTWDVAGGQLTARWDYYWQDSAFMTIFNRESHKIRSWDQHNATLIYESGSGRWSARAWIKNIENDTHITGGHRSNVQAFAVSDPRAFGASVRWNFGEI